MFVLQRLVSDLSKVERNHHILDSDRAENDIEHSFAVALLCWYINDKLRLNLDTGKILKYALLHDFAEVYAGDVNTFASQKDRDLKVQHEAVAVRRLGNELSYFSNFSQVLADYESRNDEESLFVWTVDKMQALILADLDGWRPYKKIAISYEVFIKKHQEQLSVCSPHTKEIFEALLEYCKTTYYDRPGEKLAEAK